jgi:hypothetical protein
MKLRQNGRVSFLIRLAIFQARGVAHVKLHKIKKGEPQNIEYRMPKAGIARAAQTLAPRVAKSFLKQTEYIHSTSDVERSMFDVHQFRFD